LKLILVTGKTKEFLFSPSDSAADITQHVYDNWPEGWCFRFRAKPHATFQCRISLQLKISQNIILSAKHKFPIDIK
jgi:hypothetical protein